MSDIPTNMIISNDGRFKDKFETDYNKGFLVKITDDMQIHFISV